MRWDYLPLDMNSIFSGLGDIIIIIIIIVIIIIIIITDAWDEILKYSKIFLS